MNIVAKEVGRRKSNRSLVYEAQRTLELDAEQQIEVKSMQSKQAKVDPKQTGSKLAHNF